jgi:hypothetical protein
MLRHWKELTMRRWIGKSGGLSLFCLLVLGLGSSCAPVAKPPSGPLAWPAITTTNRPWTRWWWMGSAVDKENIDALLQQYHDAGVGGVEICPIYGAYGYEDRYIQYLSPKWMAALNDATAQASQLNMGFDMTTGTGWPMGGPDVSLDDASSTFQIRHFTVAAGAGLTQPLTGGRIQCVYGFSDSGEKLDLTDKVKGDGTVDWSAPSGTWQVYSIVQRGPAMQVKRPAPGGAGNVLDPFSTQSIDDFLVRFDKAFADYHGIMPQSQFHDSYEYVGNWTDGLFEKFKAMRGYDLRDQLPALMGEGSADTVGRVLCDYRQTMADLHMAFVAHWEKWCHDHGMMAREQAHGAPANILDLYASADIPETETFGSAGDLRNMPLNQFASSAAHVTGKPLASSESFTWLGEHFQVSLAQVKPVMDYLFLSGINHMLFHGMAYSPKDVPWPGWLFYAAVDFNPNGGLWHDLPAFNAYVARCQSILQSGRPSNDLLLYFPVYDIWQRPQGTLIQFAINGNWLRDEPFWDTALTLESRGYGVDFVSDAQLANAQFADGSIILGGNTYRAVVVPTCHFMPAETAQNLTRLAKLGAPVVVQSALPQEPPGLADLDARRAALKAAWAEIAIPDPTKPAQASTIGLGSFWIGTDVNHLLDLAGASRETMVDLGLRFIRRTREGGYYYFIVNRGTEPVDGWVTLATTAQSAVILDPMFPDRTGVAAISHDKAGRPQVYLQLQPSESCFLRTYESRQVTDKPWTYLHTGADPITVSGTWKTHFIEGGPVLPADYASPTLGSWTDLGDTEAKRFAGTGRYTIDFDVAMNNDEWVLDLGKVCESARVRLNGQDLGTLISAPFQIHLSKLLRQGHNTLEIDVTNLATNRIADLDRRGVKWKIFRDINIVSPGPYSAFDASKWPQRDSGLIGPVTLTPMVPVAP